MSVRAKIIVVDDELHIESLIKQVFRKKIREGDYEFIFAANGIDALAKLDQYGDVDLALSDINMPEMDGLSLLEKLIERNPVLKVVMISAYGDMQNVRTAMNRGAFDFITKPIVPADLEATVEKTLRYVARLKSAIKLEQELSIARTVQLGLLPNSCMSNNDFEVSGFCEPAQSIGGDYYDIIQLSHAKFGIAVADASGKGVSAAIYMTLIKGLLHANATVEHSPKEVLIKINTLLHRIIKRGSFVSMIYAVMDTSTGEFSYARAGHLPPILVSEEDDVRQVPLRAKGMALGLANSAAFAFTIDEASYTLKHGDALVLYTDGFIEARNPRGEEYGMERLQQAAFVHCLNSTATDMVRAIVNDVKAFAGNAPQHDDMAMVAIKCRTQR